MNCFSFHFAHPSDRLFCLLFRGRGRGGKWKSTGELSSQLTSRTVLQVDKHNPDIGRGCEGEKQLHRSSSFILINRALSQTLSWRNQKAAKSPLENCLICSWHWRSQKQSEENLIQYGRRGAARKSGQIQWRIQCSVNANLKRGT